MATKLDAPPFMQRCEMPEKVWAFYYPTRDTYFCLWDCICVVSSEILAESFAEALDDDEERYRDCEIKEMLFDDIRDQAVLHDCDGLISVDVPEHPQRFWVR